MVYIYIYVHILVIYGKVFGTSKIDGVFLSDVASYSEYGGTQTRVRPKITVHFAQ